MTLDTYTRSKIFVVSVPPLRFRSHILICQTLNQAVLECSCPWEFYTDRPSRSRAFLGQTITTFPSEQAASIAQAVLAKVNQQILDLREKMVHREYPPRSVSELTIPDQLDEPEIGRTLRAGGRSSLGLGRRFPSMVVILVEMSQQLPLERRVALHVLVTKEILEVLNLTN